MADPFDLPRLRLEGPESREKGPDVATRSKVSTPFAQQIWVSSPCGWLIAPLIEFTRGGTVWVDSINSSARFIIPEMNDRLPLPTLLSQVLVAFTIEFDNEAERRMPHRTSNHGSTPDSLDASWLVSLAMWENCMRYVGEDGVTVHALEGLARTTTNLGGMERWGYVVIEPDPTDPRPKPPRRDWVIRATDAGRKAQDIWRPLFGTIEKRWKTRFGTDEIARLREAPWTVFLQFEVNLPDCLPILGYGLFSKAPANGQPVSPRRGAETASQLSLSSLLSRVLLAFAIEFELESELSLAICANVVRLLDVKGTRVRDLPRLSGVSKELTKVSLGFLEKRGYVVVGPDPATKPTKLVRLTSKGCEAQGAYRKQLDAIEANWLARHGKGATGDLRESLERLVVGPPGQRSPLFSCLEPQPGGWRASIPRPDRLPHYPLITHRGGFPDGS